MFQCIDMTAWTSSLMLMPRQAEVSKLEPLYIAAAGSQAAEDIVHRQKEAMMTVMADGMKVTANNKDAWNEICTCPLSLVRACDL